MRSVWGVNGVYILVINDHCVVTLDIHRGVLCPV